MLNSNIQIENSNAEENMNRKKYIIIIGLLIIISLILIVLIGFALRSDNPSQTSTNPPSPTTIPLPSPSITLIPSYPPTPIPQAGDIMIDGIAVNNFRENPIQILENGDIVISENQNFQIIFNDPNQKFTLRLLGTDFEDSRQNAENALVTILGLDEDNICRLYIEEEVPINVNNEQRGKLYPFSSCLHEEEM